MVEAWATADQYRAAAACGEHLQEGLKTGRISPALSAASGCSSGSAETTAHDSIEGVGNGVMGAVKVVSALPLAC